MPKNRDKATKTAKLNGELDHVLPPRYAEQVAEGLSNANLYIFPRVAHSPIDTAGPCAFRMMLEFLTDPTKAPDSSCMK